VKLCPELDTGEGPGSLPGPSIFTFHVHLHFCIQFGISFQARKRAEAFTRDLMEKSYGEYRQAA